MSVSRESFGKDAARDIVLVLRPEAGAFWAPPDRRLARLLKALKRGYGFQCRSAREVAEPESLLPGVLG